MLEIVVQDDGRVVSRLCAAMSDSCTRGVLDSRYKYSGMTNYKDGGSRRLRTLSAAVDNMAFLGLKLSTVFKTLCLKLPVTLCR